MSKDRKKITFNALLNHKAHNYKVVPQNVRDFIDMMTDKKPERRSGRKAKPTEQFQSEQQTED